MITPELKKRWAKIPPTIVARAANASCSGVDFMGCPKGDIYESIFGERYSHTDTDMFRLIMDALAEEIAEDPWKVTPMTKGGPGPEWAVKTIRKIKWPGKSTP